MKTILVVLVLAGFAAGPHPPTTRQPARARAEVQGAPPPSTFATTVRPILATRCAPCHNPGGRMYARLPFDDPKVVSSHSQGVLRRLKGDDREALEKWLAGLAPAAAER